MCNLLDDLEKEMVIQKLIDRRARVRRRNYWHVWNMLAQILLQAQNHSVDNNPRSSPSLSLVAQVYPSPFPSLVSRLEEAHVDNPAEEDSRKPKLEEPRAELDRTKIASTNC